jgi:hypothetical protein
MWAARDKSGELWFFQDKPVRESDGDYWAPPDTGYAAAFWETNTKRLDPFPGLTWDDEPIEVETRHKMEALP